jgi:hypothetical protein
MAYKKNLKKLQQAIIKLEQIKPQQNVQTTSTTTGSSRS